MELGESLRRRAARRPRGRRDTWVALLGVISSLVAIGSGKGDVPLYSEAQRKSVRASVQAPDLKSGKGTLRPGSRGAAPVVRCRDREALSRKGS